MSGSQQYSAASVRQLAAVVERIAPSDPARWDAREAVPGAWGPVLVSVGRARQIRMVLGMYARALDPDTALDPAPDLPTGSAADLFGPEALQEFWRVAVSGALRARAPYGEPLLLSSQRTVRDVLALLGAVVVPGRALWLPVLGWPAAKGTVDDGQLTRLFRRLVTMAGKGPLQRDGTWLSYEDRARLLALVAVVLDAAPRVSELEAMALDDVGPGEEWVRVVRAPQNVSQRPLRDVAADAGVSPKTVRRILSGEERGPSAAARQERVLAAAAVVPDGPVVEYYRLRAGTRVALRRWLAVREELVAGLEGTRSALWVTVAASKAGPKGLPIRAQGLGIAYARGMGALNFLMAGRYGWEPMPTHIEQLRRSVWAEPLVESKVRLAP
ncbi:hypothetical protein [Streptomyces sp. NPDC088348]|uniref:hypothetical protein n=1 Tax=Streptomyces sp. NPDC088348 TaxID=3365853 RepID=UPI0038021089